MQTKSCPTEIKVNVEQRIIEGYASKRNRDACGDIVAEGAFTKTLQERRAQIKVMRDHRELIGKPVAMEEDTQGLFTRSLIAKTALGEETLQLAAEGVLDGMSIGYDPIPGKVGYETLDGKATRMLREVKLYEYSFVAFPMNEAARITAVKNLHDVAEVFHATQFILDQLESGAKLTPETWAMIFPASTPAAPSAGGEKK